MKLVGTTECKHSLLSNLKKQFKELPLFQSEEHLIKQLKDYISGDEVEVSGDFVDFYGIFLSKQELKNSFCLEVK